MSGYSVNDSPAANATSVTPDDSTDLAIPTRGLYVGTGGDISVEMVGAQSAVVFTAVPAGAVLPIRVTRVNATGTTASDIVALW